MHFILLMIGLIVIIVGMTMIMLAAFSSSRGRGKSEAGGVILIGPLPIIFASNKKFLLIAVIGALIIAISMIASFLI
ncbi:MAG: DUF131 domain-containing protein [Candidatus Hodarchaeota archaeon]